ncbi:helix-turn-helix transcriptional regulator [Hymenobacter setariae]|uniref:Helix-turn-helix transcriptional regulator n=1 Tax=Hymenobacter setariae TaxID=2594794 RepID=A0A558BS34_9BACT|nr:helix-turn-helix domain-containing protein [Hymenobacter setariae]TVT39312.1 helix-turn-helix transcriptional regulator [Hymenobacter setariae]
MYKHKLERPLTCGVGVTMELLGGKWKPCLLHNIRQDLRRPSQLHRSNATATPRVLNQQLKELEADGLIYKVIHAVLPPKVEYFLTPFGESLLAVVDAMQSWGEAHGDEFRAVVARRLEQS